jgi:hypothetical protein
MDFSILLEEGLLLRLQVLCRKEEEKEEEEKENLLPLYLEKK